MRVTVVAFVLCSLCLVAFCDQGSQPKPEAEKPTYEELEKQLKVVTSATQQMAALINRQKKTIEAQAAGPITQAAYIADLEETLSRANADRDAWRDKANEMGQKWIQTRHEITKAHRHIVMLEFKYGIELDPWDVYKPQSYKEDFHKLRAATEAWAEDNLDEYLRDEAARRAAK